MQELTTTQKRLLLSRSLVILAVLLVFLAGAVVGTSFERRKSELDLTQFWNVYGLLQKEYIGTIDKEKAVEGATKGLVESLDDPYSTYLPAEEKKKLDEELSGQFDGIGAVLSTKNQQTEIVELIEDSPAAKSGLKVGDVILAVDDKSTEGLVLDDVVSKIRGPKDTTVSLLIQRVGTNDPISLKITRAKIQVKSVTSKMVGQVGVIDISQFGDDTVDGATEAVKDLKNKKFGEWTALEPDLIGKGIRWLCECSCGYKDYVNQDDIIKLKSKNCRSCSMKGKNKKHGRSHTYIYRAHYAMIKRCTNKNDKAFKHYGGRGIKVCDRWLKSFDDFYLDMGERPSIFHSLDRIDVNGDYCPENCKWSNQKEQVKNRRKVDDLQVEVNELKKIIKVYKDKYGDF